MSGKQRAVLWLGLIIIGLNLVSKWSEIKKVIFTSPSGSDNGSSGGFQIPGLPGIPGLPPIVPLSKTTPTKTPSDVAV